MTGNSKMIGCIAGKVLRVNLSNGKIWTEDAVKYSKKTLGGRGTNSLIMLNEIEPGTRWSDSANLLCFGVGSLVGTMTPGACRVDISTINVFTGGKGSANVGGSWGAELKYAGFDNIIIVGKSDKPVYLYINDQNIELRDANSVWGKTTSETERTLRHELGGTDVKIASIGPAGENRVKGSAIIVDTAKAAGGSGVGCVMGDKKLKAIVVRGHGSINVSQPERFMRAVERCYQQCVANDFEVAIMRKAPVSRLADPEFWLWDMGRGTRNGQDEYWSKEKRLKLMNHDTGIPSMIKAVRACYLCPTGCIPYIEINKGNYKGMKGEGFWLNGITSACHFDIDEPDEVLASWFLANELGLDNDYVTAGLAWIFECHEKGYITEKDTDGLELTWGNGKALIKLMKMLAYREGIGDLLADGMVEAAGKIGHGSEYYLSHVKGQPSLEGFRISKSWALGVATSPVAGRHLRGATLESYRSRLRPIYAGYKNQAELVVWQGKTKELEDNLGICSYVGTWAGAHFLKPSNYVELVNAGMGLAVTEESLINYYALIGRNLEKAFNTLHSALSREDDFPPKRFMEEEVQSGPYKGCKIDVNKYNEMLDEYYELWGWDKKTGMQTKASLERLGLKDIAKKLEERGKLADI